ncbi:unannotated protein [freshwater metagenome]|uniref:Unannotated protein n=1 Tax=freshwater metagenome TaxID=449393 RepID=A0A6J7FPS5_9ZZZZ|nr:hypothetical protein [Actinomycetota bacterium]
MSAAGSEVAQHLAEWTDAVGVAAFLGETVPASTIAELGRTERLPSVKLGSRRLFHLPTVSGALMDAMQSGRQL